MIASVLALALLIGLAVADDSTIYVSPFGDDANDGAHKLLVAFFCF